MTSEYYTGSEIRERIFLTIEFVLYDCRRVIVYTDCETTYPVVFWSHAIIELGQFIVYSLKKDDRKSCDLKSPNNPPIVSMYTGINADLKTNPVQSGLKRTCVEIGNHVVCQWE